MFLKTSGLWESAIYMAPKRFWALTYCCFLEEYMSFYLPKERKRYFLLYFLYLSFCLSMAPLVLTSHIHQDNLENAI